MNTLDFRDKNDKKLIKVRQVHLSTKMLEQL